MADIDLRELVREHGGEVYAGGRAAVLPGPGHSRKDRSLSVRLSDDGERLIFHSFANDPCRDVMQYLGIEGHHSQEASPYERERMRRLREEENRRRVAADQAFCGDIWHATEELSGSLAESYLWSRRLVLDDCPDVRFHPAAPRAKPRRDGDDRPMPAPHPAMVAIVRDPLGAPLGLHLTYIALDGSGKAFGDRSRLMFGQVAGGAVHLAEPSAGLGVGEGIETCIAYRARTGRPTWAALSTSGLGQFRPPTAVRRLWIAADGDDAGMTAAARLAERASRLADIEIDPAPSGSDWADVWRTENV